MAVPAARRGLSGERVFFLLALSSTLLLASVLMLRGEGGEGATPRAFRDGFTVAEGVVRRAESSNGTSTGAPSSGNNNLQVAIGAGVEGGRTTTIKTQDGDEITIKHAGKKQITTISRDEGGKITIENVADAAEDDAPGPDATEAPAGEDAADVAVDALGVERVEEEETAAPADEGATAEGDGGETARSDEAVIVSGGRKVTVIQVGRNLTKVELSNVDEQEDEQAPAVDELDSVSTR